jgi:hypothetical protein
MDGMKEGRPEKPEQIGRLRTVQNIVKKDYAAMVSCRFFNQSIDSLGAAQATAQAVFQQLGRIDLKISKGFLETWAWRFITAANLMF